MQIADFYLAPLSHAARSSPKALAGLTAEALQAAGHALSLDVRADLTPLTSPALEALACMGATCDDVAGPVIFPADTQNPEAAASLVRLASTWLMWLGLAECRDTLADLGPHHAARIRANLSAIVRLSQPRKG